MLDILTQYFSKQNKLSALQKEKVRVSKKSSSSGSSLFKDSLTEGIQEEYNARIDHFLTSVEDLQEELMKRPSLSIVDQYRTRLGAFLRDLFSHYQSHSFFYGRMGRRVEMKIWQSIDQTLNTLTQEIVSQNAQNFNMLKHWGVLKGLVLDLKIGKD